MGRYVMKARRFYRMYENCRSAKKDLPQWMYITFFRHGAITGLWYGE